MWMKTSLIALGNFGVLQNRKPDPAADSYDVGFLEH